MSSIVNLLNQIKHEEIVLPAIQRDFVWPEEKVLRLLDNPQVPTTNWKLYIE